MRIGLSVLTALTWITSVWALQASEAGVVDWHKTFIGVPRTDSLESSPVFHRIQSKDSTQSVILTTTENTNVLAALNPADGSIAWRYIFEATDPVLSFKKHGNFVAAVSGIGGSQFRLFDAADGDLILEKQLHSPRSGQLFSPQQLGISIAFADDNSSDIFVLTNGHTVSRLTGTTGEASWTWTSPDEASVVIYERIVVSGSTVYAVGLEKASLSYTLHVTAISSATGEGLTTANVRSSIENGPQDFFALTTAAEENPELVWLERGFVKHVPLTPKLSSKPLSLSGSNHEQIINLGLTDKGFFVARKSDGSGHVYKLEDGKLERKWEFADSSRTDENTDSIYTGAIDKDGHPYVGRLYWSHAQNVASLHVYSPHIPNERGMVTGFTFPFETNIHGIISHFTLDVVNPVGFKVLSRVVLTTSTGAVQLWQDDKLQWTREEALSTTLLAEFIELPEKKILDSQVSEDGESFAGRLTRQVADAKDFPQYLIAFIKRFTTGSYASVTSSATPIDSSEPLSRDAFGFKKIIVTANRYGKVFGIDSSNGNVVWSRLLSLGRIAAVGGVNLPLKLFVTRTVSDGETPQVVLVARRHGYDGTTDTVLFHFDPLTGEDVFTSSTGSDMLESLDIFSGIPLEAYLLEKETKTVVLVDESQQVHLYPNTEESVEAFSNIADSLRFSLQTSNHGLEGFHIQPQANADGVFPTYSAWSMSVPSTEVVHSVIRAPQGPIASLGRVLGNRTTLYKYLNPHLFAITTVPKAPGSGSCAIYLVDGAKGSIVYHADILSKGPCSIKAVLTENWLVYSYYDEEYQGSGQTKGHRVVSVEIYEGQGVNAKTRSSELSSFSEKMLDISTHEMAFGSFRGISTMATTSTKFGMTTKNVIMATKNNQIQSIPRRLLDPRRPKGKPTAQEAEEMLVQYDPNLPVDPRFTISHNYEVANVRKIITSPALLESTSLVFAFGIDLFGSRVAPSNTFDVLSESFNKLQLVFTIAGLGVAIIITRPMVYRKRLRERWYQ